MESNLTSLEALVKGTAETINALGEIAENMRNALMVFVSFQKETKRFTSNNYLKMHGKRTVRRKALALYKRRHHGG